VFGRPCAAAPHGTRRSAEALRTSFLAEPVGYPSAIVAMSHVGSDLSEASDTALPGRGGGDARIDPPVAETFADAPNRLIAYLLDAVVLTLLAFVAAIVLSVAFGPVVTFDATAAPYVTVDRGLALANAIVSTAIGAGYFVVAWRRFGATVGMRLLRMRISTVGGDPVGWGQGAVRWLFIGLPLANQAFVSVYAHGRADVVLYLALLAWDVLLGISIARDPRKRGWHDRVAGTVVRKRANLAPPGIAPPDRGAGVR
jgi:uncharacterized RDD family membrane protein YckC